MNLYKLLKEQINMDRQAFSGAWLNSAAAGVVLGPIYTLSDGGGWALEIADLQAHSVSGMRGAESLYVRYIRRATPARDRA